MVKRFFQGTLITVIIGVVPTIGNLAVLREPQIWLLIMIGILGNMFQPSYKAFDTTRRQDKGTALQNLWTVLIVQLITIIEATYYRFPGSFTWDIFVSLSLALMVLGLILRTWAVVTLGKFFTWHVTVQENQKVIRNGPYRFIRHPSYTGAMLTYFFATIYLHSWFSMIIAVFILPLAFMRRIKLEEMTLKQNLGQDYEQYCREVKALIPFVL